jgi:hypothetical protein
VDGTGSGSCPMAGFGISGVEPSDSATRDLVTMTLSLCSITQAYIFMLCEMYFTHVGRIRPTNL